MKTILAVDDSATMREMVAFVLESAGYRVIEQKAGRGAVAISLDTFMGETGLGRCSVRRSVRLAEELGFISVAVGPRHNHEFRLTDDWRDVDADEAKRRVAQARLPTPPRPRTAPPKPVRQAKVEVERIEPQRYTPSLPQVQWLGR